MERIATKNMSNNVNEMSLVSPRASTPSSQPTRLNTLNAYLYHHGYRMGKLIGEGSYSKVRLCPRRSDTEESHEKDPAVACKVLFSI